MEIFAELTEAQKRQFLDAESVFEALEHAEAEGRRHRGSMFWREQDGRKYLIRMSANSRQKSLGVFSAETRKTFERFNQRKSAVEERVKQLRSEMETWRRMNKALRVGRTPDLLVDVLNVLARADVAQHFLLVGTNALYAYETAAGVRFPSDVMATRDADFLFDTRSRAEFLEVMKERDASFIGLLRKADKTFQRHDTDNYTAVNSKGYEIDLIRRFPPDPEDAGEHPIHMTDHEDDLWAVRASMGEKLLSSQKFSQVVVGTNGGMARMTTVHPMAFARIKRALAKDRERDPLKARKDAMQARLVTRLIEAHLPHLQEKGAAGKPASRAP
ncbi:MAG: nucleotidyltransferase domain-containing protein [Ramlibacter sp.]